MSKRKLSIPQVYKLARGRGLTHAEAVTATAVAIGESGLRPDAVGDTSLTDGTWGPSVGLWQVRSLKAQTGTGKSRDVTRLKDPRFNARAMDAISSDGSNWRPWSVYTSGAYRGNLATVRAALSGKDLGSVTMPAGDGSGGSGGPVRVQMAGYQSALNLTPWGIPLNPFKLPGYLARKSGEAGGAAAGGALMDAIGPLVLSTVLLGGGVALVVVGLGHAIQPKVQQAVMTAAQMYATKGAKA